MKIKELIEKLKNYDGDKGVASAIISNRGMTISDLVIIEIDNMCDRDFEDTIICITQEPTN